MDFDPDTALAYARALARPRLVESAEHAKVAQEIVEKLESFGCRVEREPFQFTRAFEAALLGEIALALGLIALPFAIPRLSFGAGLLLLALLAFIPTVNRLIHLRVAAPDGRSRTPKMRAQPVGRGLLSLYRSFNIVARPAVQPAESEAAHLYLMAHYDSKSQRLPLAWRMTLIVLLIASAVLFALTALFSSPSALAAALAFVSGIPLLFIGVENKSPGAIDNASGVGLVLHLAEILQSRHELLSKVQVTFLVTSAEELAALGAIHHLHEHADEWAQAHELYMLNFDGIGAEGRLCYVADEWGEALVDLVKSAGRELSFPLGSIPALGALYDHVPFADYARPHLAAITLVTVGKDALAIHTPADTPGKLHPRGFEMAGRVALKVIETLAVPRG